MPGRFKRTLPALLLSLLPAAAVAQVRYPLSYPPRLPDGQTWVRHQSEEMLRPGPNLREGVEIGETPPVVEFMYYPGQDYAGNPV